MADSGWFESVAQAQRRASRRLPSSVYAALVAGSEQGISSADNLTAFDELGFAPHVVGSVTDPDLRTRVLGLELPLPVLISPTGVQAVHPDGEVGMARGAAARGVAMGLSDFASRPVEEVVAANPLTLFQTCWRGDRKFMAAQLERARRAGVVGLIVTLDWSFSQGRDGGSPVIPERIDLRTAVRFAPQVLRRPAWLAGFLRSGRLPDLTVPNLDVADGPAPTFFAAYRDWAATPPPSWEDVTWLRDRWDGPFVVKGICRVDDARRAVDAGATAISVSNHGGNDLDGIPAPVRCLPAIAAAVGDDLDVLLDGGVRRGSDVVKALALGADAVMIGRASLWGLAANGPAGVENVLDLLRAGIVSALRGLDVPSVRALTPNHLVVPPEFTHPLGGV